jgi:hypothetical protein
MGVKIVEPRLVEQRFLDDLVSQGSKKAMWF